MFIRYNNPKNFRLGDYAKTVSIIQNNIGYFSIGSIVKIVSINHDGTVDVADKFDDTLVIHNVNMDSIDRVGNYQDR